jgi:hypothetical protein
MAVLPSRFLFRFAMPIRHVDRGRPGQGLELDQAAPLPELGGLDGAASFATVQAGWHETGLGFRVRVAGKKMPLAQDPEQPAESDGFQLWLDTRNTQTIHRASRFCHRFIFLPGTGKKSGPPASAVQLPLSLAKEDPSFKQAGMLRCISQIAKDGYVLDAWIPAESLTGYEPESNPLLGFYYAIRDAELGEQVLSVGRDFPFDHDPSLWSTLELTR